MTDLVETLLDEEEGRSRTVYPDNRGFWTISRGCVVDPKVPGAGLCDAAMAAQDEHDTLVARTLAAQFPHYAELNEVRRAVLISMCFQMGSKPLYWRDFNAALAVRDYVRAADAGRDSDWWRTQTPKRAEREMKMLSSGEWVEGT